VHEAVTEAVLMGIDGTGRVAPASTLVSGSLLPLRAGHGGHRGTALDDARESRSGDVRSLPERSGMVRRKAVAAEESGATRAVEEANAAGAPAATAVAGSPAQGGG
jgi:hypothetical protein